MQKDVGVYRKEDKEYLVRIRDLRNLIALERTIVKTASYQVKGKYSLTNPDEVRKALEEMARPGIFFQDDGLTIRELPRPLLVDGTPVYSDVNMLYEQSSLFSPTLVFEGTKRVAPDLARRVDLFLGDNTNGVDEFIAYKDHDELVPITTKIKGLKRRLNQIDDIEERERINAELDVLTDKLANGEYFNTELLKRYYSQAGRLIEMQERGSKRTLSLHDYRCSLGL